MSTRNAPVAIYDSTDPTKITAYCEKAFDIGYRMQTDAVWSAWFSLPLDDPKNDEISARSYVEIWDGEERVELFRVRRIRTHRRAGVPVKTYYCEHVLATLLDDMLIGVHDAGPGTTVALNYVLGQQTTAHWELDTNDYSRNFYHNWEDESLLKALLSIPTRFTTDHRWEYDTTDYPWKLSLRTAPTTVSAYMRYGKEQRDLQKDADAEGLYTRIYPFGFGAGADQLDVTGIDQADEGRPEFTSGSTEFTVGETLTGASSGATAVVSSYLLESGAWADGDAQGPLFLTSIVGTFTDGEDLNGSVSGANCATLDSSLDHVNAESIVTYGVIARNWEDQRYAVEANLYEKAVEKVDEASAPETTYTGKAADVYRLAGRNQFVLGDLVTIYDSELGIDVDVRLTLVKKGDVEGEPGDLELRFATKDEKFPNFGDIVWANDLDGVYDGTYGKVLSTSISAGKILLSQIAGGQLGAIPSPPTIAGLYLGSDHLGFHDGSNWITYMDENGILQLNGIGADNAHLQWDPSGGGVLDIKGTVNVSGTINATAGSVGGFDIAANTLSAGTTHIILDSTNKAISINDAAFGNDGIQLEYNAGTPRAYIGDGVSDYMSFTSGSGLTVSGTITITGGSGIANLTDAGALAVADTVGASDCDATIISGGKIITGLLTASNIQTGTLDCDVITVSNLDADQVIVSGGTTLAGWRHASDTTKIDGGDIYTNSVTATQISVSTLSALSANMGTLTAGTINATATVNAGAISTGTLNCSSITVSNLSASSINTGTLSATYISGGTLDFSGISKTGLSVLNAELAGGITYGKISSVDAATISTGILTGRKIQTASSGARGVLEVYGGPVGGGAELNFYDSSNNLLSHMRGGNIQLLDTNGDIRFLASSNTASYVAEFDQTGASAADPVIKLRQQDLNREFIEFRGTAANGSIARSIVDYGDEGGSVESVWLMMHVTDDGNQVADGYYFLLGYLLS